MHLERLFNVLVLQGALIGGGCEPLPDEPGGGEGPGSSAGESTDASASATESGDAGSAETSDSGDSGSAGQGSEASTSASTDVSTDSVGEGSTDDRGDAGASSSESTGEPLMCTEGGNANDPCGCPCCWIMECINTEPCCEAWSQCAQA